MTLDEYAFQNLIDENEELKNRNDTLEYRNESLEQENKELKEFKEKREESMFYFKALIERAEPKTAREAEDLQKAKMIFEKLYREKLGYLEQENTKLKEENKKFKADTEHTIKFNNKIIGKLKLENDKLKEENELLKQCLDDMMFKADIINVKIHGELGDYVYVRSDKQLKLNVKD